MTEKRLAQLERLVKEATEGPWNPHPVNHDYIYGRRQVVARMYDDASGKFICESRTALPELVAEVRRLNAAMETIISTVPLTKDRAVEIARAALAGEEQGDGGRVDCEWIEAMLPGGTTDRQELQRRAQGPRRIADWQELPECPYCGAIQELSGQVLFHGAYTCHSCGEKYELQTHLAFRTKKVEDS